MTKPKLTPIQRAHAKKLQKALAYLGSRYVCHPEYVPKDVPLLKRRDDQRGGHDNSLV